MKWTILRFLIYVNSRDGNLVDSMIARLEKYATSLEDLVAERTQQLEIEKRKTDDLLYKMLPK